MFQTTAKVQVKNGDKLLGEKNYDKVVFEGVGLTDKKEIIPGDPETLLGEAIAYFQAQVGEKGNGVIELLKNATYANDLGQRNKIRAVIVASLEGPEKAIEKAIKDLMAARQSAGKPISEEAARAKVMAFMADAE
jgi:hypothetical protein